MIKKEMYLKDIADSLALLSREVEILNCVNFYDINIVAEDFFAELLNLIYGYNLKNLNVVEKNAIAIDLFDEKKRICIQVTSDNSSEKIKETIHKFIEKQNYSKYDRLVVLILTKKKKYTTAFDTDSKFRFDRAKDIIECEDLMKVVRGKNVEELQILNEFLSSQFCKKVYETKATQASEIDTIIDLIEYITKNRTFKKRLDTVIDPDYKINSRFKEFAKRIKSEYTSLYPVYGDAINTIYDTLGVDEAQDLITILYLQGISIKYLDDSNNDPIDALNKLVSYFEDKISTYGKKYDRSAIKFYLVDEIIKCNVFPNERSEYDGNK